MNRPRIALLPMVKEGVVSLNETYLSAIWDAGGDPVVSHHDLDPEYIGNVCEESDGFLFCGGEDIDPKYYGEEKSEKIGNICSKRDEFEAALFDIAYKTGKPILGICRGMQAINVFLGGSLHQHIDGHVQKDARNVRTHAVELMPDGWLYDWIGTERVDVNSFHHQVVKGLADGLSCDAISVNGGYIEAFHHVSYPFMLGVQWHPENYHMLSDSSAVIFSKFVDACRK